MWRSRRRPELDNRPRRPPLFTPPALAAPLSVTVAAEVDAAVEVAAGAVPGAATVDVGAAAAAALLPVCAPCSAATGFSGLCVRVGLEWRNRKNEGEGEVKVGGSTQGRDDVFSTCALSLLSVRLCPPLSVSVCLCQSIHHCRSLLPSVSVSVLSVSWSLSVSVSLFLSPSLYFHLSLCSPLLSFFPDCIAIAPCGFVAVGKVVRRRRVQREKRSWGRSRERGGSITASIS